MSSLAHLQALPAITAMSAGRRVDVSTARDPSPEVAGAPPMQMHTDASRMALQSPLVAARLVIEFDPAAERFIQTLLDSANDTVLRRYPDEGQLAFSRGIKAYITALARR
jgi:hypothetical protein